MDFLCATHFPRCQTAIVGDIEVAFPNVLCLGGCEAWWTACSGMLQAALAYGQGHAVPSCGTEGHGVGPVDTYGVKTGTTVLQFEYPDGLQGEPFFAEASQTWSSPDDPSMQVELRCVTPGNGTAPVTVALDCLEDTMLQYDIGAGLGESCFFMCPHPLFTPIEYSIMRILYVVPGFIGGGLCIFLLLDTLRVAFSRSKAAKNLRKEAIFEFQALVGLCGTVFFVIGPFPVAFAGDIGCNGMPVIPGVMDIAYVPNESATCVLQRASIFALMALFNTGLAHMVTTHNMLLRATQMHVSCGQNSKKRRARRIRLLLFIALIIPAGLCAAMYSLDKLDQHSNSYQGQLARWSLMCGPRLTTAQELALVYVPFALTGFLVTVQSVRSWRLMTHIISSDNGASGTNLRLRTLNQKVTLLGFLCAVSLTLFVIATSQLVPALANSTQRYMV